MNYYAQLPLPDTQSPTQTFFSAEWDSKISLADVYDIS